MPKSGGRKSAKAPVQRPRKVPTGLQKPIVSQREKEKEKDTTTGNKKMY
jgi:hypothetical protein